MSAEAISKVEEIGWGPKARESNAAWSVMLNFSVTKWRVLMHSGAKCGGAKMYTFEKWGHGSLHHAKQYNDRLLA